MESRKISLQNLQNIHFTNWLRVVDLNFVFLFSSFTTWSMGTLLCFFVGRFSVGEQFSEIFGQFSLRSLKTVPLKGVALPGDQFLYFIKWSWLIFIIFYLVWDTWLRLARGSFYCIFIYIFVLVVNLNKLKQTKQIK